MTACPRFARRALASALLALAPLAALASTTLHDPASGSLPSAQGGLPLALGGLPLALGAPASQGLGGGVYALDTSGAGVSFWGHRIISPLPLDTQAGFDRSFGLQLLGLGGLGLAGLALRRR